VGKKAQSQLPLRLRARTKEGKEKGPPKGTETRKKLQRHQRARAEHTPDPPLA